MIKLGSNFSTFSFASSVTVMTSEWNVAELDKTSNDQLLMIVNFVIKVPDKEGGIETPIPMDQQVGRGDSLLETFVGGKRN